MSDSRLVIRIRDKCALLNLLSLPLSRPTNVTQCLPSRVYSGKEGVALLVSHLAFGQTETAKAAEGLTPIPKGPTKGLRASAKSSSWSWWWSSTATVPTVRVVVEVIWGNRWHMLICIFCTQEKDQTRGKADDKKLGKDIAPNFRPAGAFLPSLQ